MFAIVLVFSSTVPIVTLAGSLFLFLRHCVDGYTLLTVHKKEMESSQSMFKRIVWSVQVILLIYQCSMVAFFSIKGMHWAAIASGFILVATLWLFYTRSETLFDPLKDPQIQQIEKFISGIELRDDQVSLWRKEFSHPLMISSAAAKAQALGPEVRNIDEWPDFMADREIKEILETHHRRSGWRGSSAL